MYYTGVIPVNKVSQEDGQYATPIPNITTFILVFYFIY